jgi:coatomer subunit beta'
LLGQKKLALKVSTDADHQFDLSIQLDDLETALSIAQSIPDPESESKWKAVGDKALSVWKFGLAKQCYEKAGDASALLLLGLASGDRVGLESLAKDASAFLTMRPSSA